MAENQLPKQLRADLVSIGLWVLKELEEIRMERSTNFRGVIEVTQSISAGLA
jgi:flagellar protein FlaF